MDGASRPGTGIAYARVGPQAGRPVVLLHPWFGCAAFWKPVLPALAECCVYNLDLYSPAADDWTVSAAPEALASAVVEVIEGQTGGPVDLIGNSMGGILAQIVASSRPELVARMVLIGTGARSSGLQSEFAAKLAAWIDRPDRAELPGFTRGLVAPHARDHPAVLACIERLARVNLAYLSAVPRSTLGLDLRPRLAAVRAPTLIVRGELDSIRTRAHVSDLVASIEGATAVEIPGAGHSPMVDSSEECGRIVRGFLTR